MKRCVLLAGGPFEDYDRAVPEIGGGDFLIACDRGFEAAQRLKLHVDLLVGDFDSYSGEIPADVPVERAAAEKDDTDTILGVRRGLALGYRDFLLLGALGGRLDHTLANLQTLSLLCEENARGQICSNRARIWAVRNGALDLEGAPGYVSVFAWGGPCDGVTLEGLRYPLRDARLEPGFPLGVSNAFADKRARIQVREGTLLVLHVSEGEALPYPL